MLASVIHTVLEVLLVEVPLVLPTKELSVLLGMLLTQLIEPQVEAGKLICEKLMQRKFLGFQGAAITLATLMMARWCSRALRLSGGGATT